MSYGAVNPVFAHGSFDRAGPHRFTLFNPPIEGLKAI
jgi:hypothetical protein